MSRLTKFAKFAWLVLAVNLLTVVWGAYVRASGSGAGCGSHWPLCNGVVVPHSPQIETIIEFTHRMMSGFSLILIAVMLVWAFRTYPRRHIVRLGASLSAIFIITEALVGAGLVLFNWVAGNASLARVISMAIHLINTFLLLACLSLTAWWASSGETVSLKRRGISSWVFAFGFLGLIILGVSGAITALGDTLFPAISLVEGIRQDFSGTAHFLVRMRVWHPVIAIIMGSYLILVGGISAMHAHDEVRSMQTGKQAMDPQSYTHFRNVRTFALILLASVASQMLAGLINLLLLAPVWMQLLHLFLADTVWIAFTLLAANVFSELILPEETAQSRLDHATASLQDLKMGNNLAKYTDFNVD